MTVAELHAFLSAGIEAGGGDMEVCVVRRGERLDFLPARVLVVVIEEEDAHFVLIDEERKP